MTGTHASGYDQDIVSRAHATVSTTMAHESFSLCFGNVVGRWRIKIRRQISHERHVVRHVCVSDLLSGVNAERGPDWLTKLSYKLARRDVSGGEAMTGRHCAMKLNDTLVGQDHLEIGERSLLDHSYIVSRVDDDRVLADLVPKF